MPGSPKTSVAPADTERERLPGPNGNAPEVLLDAELGQDPADEVVRTDGDAPGADEHICIEAALERPPVRSLVVGNGADPLHLCAGGLESRCQHRRVRLVDLPRAEPLSGRAQLGAGAEDDDLRPPGDRHLRHAHRGERADLGGADPSTGGEQQVAGTDVAADRPDVGAEIDRSRDVQFVV